MSSKNSKVRWQVFPRYKRIADHLSKVVAVFESNEHLFKKTRRNSAKQAGKAVFGLESNDVLRIIKDDLKQIDFRVEEAADGTLKKIPLPITYGENGSKGKTFNVDAYHQAQGVVLEVEAGRAVANNAAYYDFLKGCALQDVRHIVIAVMLDYNGHSDYDTVYRFFDDLWSSNRLQFPIDSLLLIGYPVCRNSAEDAGEKERKSRIRGK